MKSTRVSTLDKRVRIETPIIERERMGQQNKPKAWELVKAVWAGIRTPSGRELENASQRKAQVSLVVTMRYIPSDSPGRPIIDPTMRLVYMGRELNIVWINNVGEANRQLDVYCSEKVSPS